MYSSPPTKMNMYFLLLPFCLLWWVNVSCDCCVLILHYSPAVSMMKRPAITDYQSAESEQLMKRLRPGGHGIDEVMLHMQSRFMTTLRFVWAEEIFFTFLQATYPAPIPQSSWSLDDLPKTVACTLSQGSNVTSMDFHPSRNTLLLGTIKIANLLIKKKILLQLASTKGVHVIWVNLWISTPYRFSCHVCCSIVGSANGEITLWEIGLRERLVSKPFKIWDMQACSAQFQVTEHKLKFWM
jgi:hypothetical protein